jgi:putative membrane-bound dehydrogenase-like protein
MKPLPALLVLLACAPQDDPLRKELPRLPHTEAKDALKTFRIKPGYRIDLVACEPAVSDPVDLSFDEEGRLWVVEMIDYPFGDKEGNPPQGRLKVLEDADGDGRFENSRVLAERLRWPTSLALWDGGAFVATVPDIVYVKDGKSEVAFTGFSDQNVQGLLNNLKWGIDNWFAGTSGSNGGTVLSRRRPDLAPLSVRGRDFRFRSTGEIEPLSGGGQFGHAMDDYGRRFVCSNSVQARHVVLEDRYLAKNPLYAVRSVTTSIAADGDSGPVFRTSPAEPWRIVRTRMRLAKEVPGPVEHGGAVTGYFTSATGITFFDGRLYIGDVASNLVHRKSLTPAGSTFRADRIDPESEFLVSSDNWFRPVNFATGPDGALYICDMYRECIEHPYSIPDSIKKHLDLTSGKDRGRIWRVARDGDPGWTKPRLKSTEELVAALARPEPWWRQTAGRLLFQRQDRAALPGLERLLADPKPETRVAALWALEGLGVRRGEALLRDPVSAVREHAARLAPLEALYDLSDPDPRVRLEIAWRMTETADPRRAAVLERLRAGADAWLRTAVAIAAGEKTAETARKPAPPPAPPAAPVEADRRMVIERYRPALQKGGDAARGREVYRKLCQQCHKAKGEGRDVGPDLATVKDRSPEDLLTNLLDPNREVNPQYLSTRILTKDGAVLDGIVATETATSVTLKRAQGEVDTLLKIRIEKMVTSKLSLMPEGVERDLDLQGMADLIAFMRGQ